MEAPDSPPPPPSKRVIPAQRYRKGDPLPKGVSGAPNERKLVELMEKTGCMISQTNGQRRFGPPPDWPPDEPRPPYGCEVFIGKIPRDFYEDELVPVLQTIGRLYELRLMMDFSAATPSPSSRRATRRSNARALDNYEIRRGRSLSVCMSVDNWHTEEGHQGGYKLMHYLRKLFRFLQVVCFPRRKEFQPVTCFNFERNF